MHPADRRDLAAFAAATNASPLDDRSTWRALARRWTNSLTAVQLMIADGSLVRADATTNPELFWALRGGGGNFGVVAALEVKLYDIEATYPGIMVWRSKPTPCGSPVPWRSGPAARRT